MNLLTVLLLFTAFLITRVSSLRLGIQILLVQSIAVAVACVWSGIEAETVHTLIAALLTVVIKAWLIPYALFRVVKRLRDEQETKPILSPNQTSLAAALVLAVTYGVMDQALPGVSRDILSGALALFLIGLLIMITRRQAVLQIIGLIMMENGLYLLGLSMTKGLPLIIEFGVFFDILVAVIVLGILTWRLKLSFQTTDTTVLRKLKG
ncbi:MAG: hydrogenase [Veillonellaceae bacterium]|nr:hydrogenase [Veillonellaceae bacterium]